VVPRDVSQLGRHMLWLAVLGSTILLALVLAVLSRMFSLLVLKPLGRVEEHMQRVRNSGALTMLPQDAARRDEIASLGRSFNAMLVQLKELREQVEAQGFELGRSESAVAVMHNVRNALNPVSTILSAGIDQGAPVERTLIDRALAELVAAETAPERRELLVRNNGSRMNGRHSRNAMRRRSSRRMRRSRGIPEMARRSRSTSRRGSMR
jgi:HAMP domain-containing protein